MTTVLIKLVFNTQERPTPTTDTSVVYQNKREGAEGRYYQSYENDGGRVPPTFTNLLKGESVLLHDYYII